MHREANLLVSQPFTRWANARDSYSEKTYMSQTGDPRLLTQTECMKADVVGTGDIAFSFNTKCTVGQ